MQLAQIQTIPEVVNVLKVLVTGAVSFFLAFLVIPLWTKILYKYKIGVKIKSNSVDGQKLVYVNKLHADKSGTPTMGGVIIWVVILILAFASHYLFPYFAKRLDVNFIARLDFLSRSQVWLPLFALVTAGILGLFDDFMSVRGWGKNKGGGMKFAMRFWWLIIISVAGAWWFFGKLGWDIIHIPAVGDFSIGFWYIPVFMLVIIFSAISSNETDGLDGLNGGVMLMAFSSFAVLAFIQNKIDLASFCAAVSGTLLAFLWFNVYPARFFMGDTGAMSLGVTLGIVAMLTNTALLLPVIAFVLVLESGSVIVQTLSKRFRHKKIFESTPIHHHFEALGWPETKVTMRFWIISAVTAAIGLVVGLLGQ
ncbi:MAG: phospho-N-acetylmuramoyl-pentapeptide-transferase [Candidatus Moranbacteria bacterium RIFCSPHIGHO2_12_FULL_40_10]|nr:MAG: phospho-N-acetylmuramoyl-pentapeptide-transferase [Candidatus Moranbacteria bacterium RIFCSPHIGHO2_12_FULL_40_10]